MAIDYTALAEDARTLIEENGRAVTLKKFSETPQDSNKPWRGRDSATDDTVDATAILAPFESQDVDGQIVRMGDQRCILAAASQNVAGRDIETFDSLDDSGVTGVWKIVSVQLIQPGDTAIVYDIQLRG